MSEAKILDGRALSKKIKQSIKQEIISKLRTSPDIRPPKLAVVLIGDDTASRVYVSHKISSCQNVGIDSVSKQMGSDCTMEQAEELMGSLAGDASIDGILLQLPLPAHLDKAKLIQMIPPEKDVDGLTVYSQGALSYQYEGHYPCTPLGIIELIKTTGIPLVGKVAAVIGRSALVGASVTRLLEYQSCTTISIASKTKDPDAMCRQADIVVAAAGVKNLVKESWIKDGAIVIDVGIHREEKGLTGDVDFENVKKKASWITPVPGGVGPMTIAMLLNNCLKTWKRRQNF